MENKKRYNPNVETNVNPFIGKKDPLKYLELTLSCRIPIRLEDGIDMVQSVAKGDFICMPCFRERLYKQ